MQMMETAVPNVNIYLNSEGKIVIPLQDEQLRINIIAAAHQGKHGHCKEKQTCKLMNEVFAWHGMRDQVNEWVKRCLQCIKLAGGHRIPRPMGHQLLAQKPMEVVAIDFLSIKSNRRGGFKHILVIVDQLTRICVLVPTKDQTAATAARIFCERWLAFFPEPTFVISDGGPHFTADLFHEIAAIRGFQHHITAPYSQWSNGGVERLNKVVEDRLAAILNARSDPWTAWPGWTPAIQEAANKRIPVSNRDNKTPMELLMGEKPKSALKYIAWLGVDASERAEADNRVVEAHLADIHQHLPQLWAKAVQSQQKRRRQNAKPGLGVPRIHVGDLVLVAEAVHGHKLRMRWTGPHEVIDTVNKYCYRVRPIVPPPQKRKTITAHIVRIRRFSNAALGTDADRRRIEESAVKDFPDNFVHKFVGHRRNPTTNRVELKVRWLGFDAAGDTWESIAELADSVPDMVEDYLREHQDPMLDRIRRQFF